MCSNQHPRASERANHLQYGPLYSVGRYSTNANRIKIRPFLNLGQEHQNFQETMFLNTYNWIHNNKVKIYRYVINRGEVVLTSDLSFKIFNLVLDFKYLNYYRLKIDNYTEILLWEMVGFQIGPPS